MKLFDHLKNLTSNKIEFDDHNDEQYSSYDPYIINRFISMDNMYVDLVNNINMFDGIPKKNHYDYYFNFLPKRNHYFKYIKKNKVSNDEKEIDRILMDYFQIGQKDVDRYREFLTEEQLNDIIGRYSYGTNT
jgi:hypothetical protein